MAKVITINSVKEVVHAPYLQKAGIHDFREWAMSVNDSLLLVYAKIGPGGNSGMPVRHETEEAAFVIKGELVYVIEGKEIKVPENASIFIPEGEEHFIRNDTKETVLRLSIHTIKKW